MTQPANQPQPRKKSKKRELLAGLALLVVIVGGGLGALQAMAAKTGERCDDSGCKWGNVCISHRCYAKCSADGDCPTNMHCGKTDVNVTIQHHVFFKEEHDDTEQICFANKSAVSSSASAAH